MNHEIQNEVHKKTGALRLYRHYLSIILRSKMQYKKSFFLTSVGLFFTSFCVLLSIFFLFQRFSNVNGYTYREILLCYAIVLTEFTLTEIYARGIDNFPGMVRRGDFDRVLLRPRSLLLQVLGSECNLERFSRLLEAAAILIYAVTTCGVSWTPLKIATVVFMLIGGCAMFSGIFLIHAAVSFFTLEGLEFTNIFTYGLNEYGKYPLDVYSKGILWFLTYIIPFSLVQYYPLLYILDRRTEVGYVFLPLLAILFLLPCYLFWRFGVRRYKSSGS